ncbi:PREDICTED: synapse differentiation-inducing gene protein 1-like [Branchiostoma belcheri]|uniref:Synapse differentiation-inducing gene protein 1-like n=1 Tax=Branchiostoma belcheri TaxID=7741 RepID=A0A6P4XVX1_BRABE|nr:PREDICTED: synapse differentiation-inducing gene protein 1-like [Branchiostoma belcheri]
MADAGAFYPPPAYTDKSGEQQPQQAEVWLPTAAVRTVPPSTGTVPPSTEAVPPSTGAVPSQVKYTPQGQSPGKGGYVQMETTTVAMTEQPTTMVVHTRANDYMCLSLFTLLCFFPPLGIAACVRSCQTQDANNAGDINRAQAASYSAKHLNYWALRVGIVLWVYAVLWTILSFSVKKSAGIP